jgi:hypothetical protein
MAALFISLFVVHVGFKGEPAALSKYAPAAEVALPSYTEDKPVKLLFMDVPLAKLSELPSPIPVTTRSPPVGVMLPVNRVVLAEVVFTPLLES